MTAAKRSDPNFVISGFFAYNFAEFRVGIRGFGVSTYPFPKLREKLMVTNPHWLLTFPSRKSHENREGRPVTVFLTVVKVAILLGSISSRKVLPCSRGAPSKFLDTKRDRENTLDAGS